MNQLFCSAQCASIRWSQSVRVSESRWFISSIKRLTDLTKCPKIIRNQKIIATYHLGLKAPVLVTIRKLNAYLLQVTIPENFDVSNYPVIARVRYVYVNSTWLCFCCGAVISMHPTQAYTNSFLLFFYECRSATDADEGVNSALRYSIIGGNSLNIFSIDSLSKINFNVILT